MAQESLGYVRLIWTCPNCNTRNPGPNKFCTSCGAPQAADVQFETPSEEQLVTDQKELEAAKAGADFHCGYCGARNPAGSKTCSQCSADLTGAIVRPSGRIMQTSTGKDAKVICPSCGTENSADAARCVSCGGALEKKAEEAAPAQTGGFKKFGIIAIIIFVVLLAIAGLICYLTGKTTDSYGKVQSVEWMRAVSIEEYRPVERQGWKNEIPSGVKSYDCVKKVYKTQSEPVAGAKKTCGTPYLVEKGSGYAQKVQDCFYEVTQDWCSYMTNEWTPINPVVLKGNDLNPEWPDVNLLKNQRERGRSEDYAVVFDLDGKTNTYKTTDFNQFSQCKIGSNWKLKINTFNTILNIEPVK